MSQRSQTATWSRAPFTWWIQGPSTWTVPPTSPAQWPSASPATRRPGAFTRVLKGHIALATALFPEGTTGSQLDALARRPLWEAGLDYDHGTGHGVGSYLGIHEGPQRISKVPNRVPLQAGMVLSNEPGYYKTGAYGIRIENLVAVTAVPVPAEGERQLLGFETLTLAPIDLRLVRTSLLGAEELAWLDSYHAGSAKSSPPGGQAYGRLAQGSDPCRRLTGDGGGTRPASSRHGLPGFLWYRHLKPDFSRLRCRSSVRALKRTTNSPPSRIRDG